MPDSWAISGRDLHLDLGRIGRRVALERALREAVQSGRLAPGTLLPPSRALASDLGIARNTVAEAYTQLVAEGWLTARQGSGTRVAAPPTGAASPTPVSGAIHRGESAVSTPPVGRFGATDGAPGAAGRAGAVGRVGATGGTRGGGGAGGARGGLTAPRGDVVYDLRAGYPDVVAFPHGEWLAAARTALGRAPSSAYRYPDPQGLPELRTALAGYLARTRGVRVTPERVVVCAGFGQGLWALAAALHRLGARRVGVESHGLRMHREILADAGLRLVGLPVGAAGAQLPGDDVDAVLLTPAHQFPLGVALEHRAEFVRWARTHRAVLVEDDYDGEFRYDRRPLGAMQALAPDHVVYGGTASKALAPAVGLAWLVPPEHLVAPVVAELTRLGARPAALNQLVLAEFLTSGRYDRHVRRSRLAYRRRRDRLVAALGDLRVHGLPAGLHAVVDLPDGRTEEQAVTEAGRRGLAVQGLAEFAFVPGHAPALVVGYATPPAHAFTSAIARLVATLSRSGAPAAPPRP